MTSGDVSSCLVYTCHQDRDVEPRVSYTCHYDPRVTSLVMQSCVTAASSHNPDTRGGGVLVVMAGESWSSLPPSWHLMPVLTPDIMKTIKFIYPANNKV